MISLLTMITFLYACTGIIAAMGYWPTIIDLLKKKQSANINSYIIWSFTGLVAFLYALFVISDPLLEIVTGLSFASCAIILLLSLRLKYRILT